MVIRDRRGFWPLLLLAAGCTPGIRWLREDVHPVAVHGDRRLDRARIWTRDTVVQWRAVLITPDSISGIPDRGDACDSCRVALATSVVDSIEVGYSTSPNPRIDTPADTVTVEKVMMTAQGDLTAIPGGGSADLGFHLSWKTPAYVGVDGAIATSVLGGTYDYADGDLSIDAIPFIKDITLSPRVGLSSLIVGDKHAFSGVNYGLAIRRRRSRGGILRVDLIYRRVQGYALYTVAVGEEFRP